eukprot:350048-Chlamydomonas_euryale.AAC.13
MPCINSDAPHPNSAHGSVVKDILRAVSCKAECSPALVLLLAAQRWLMLSCVSVCEGVRPIAYTQREVSLLDVCNITNIENGSPKLWAHLVTVFIITGIVLKRIVVDPPGQRPVSTAILLEGHALSESQPHPLRINPAQSA